MGVKVNVRVGGVNVSVGGVAVNVSVGEMFVEVETISSEGEAGACSSVLFAAQADVIKIRSIRMVVFVFMG
jgi:hypothetical protein